MKPRANARNNNLTVAAIILAAGQSRRAGTINKLLAPIDGTAMVAHVAREVCSSHVAQVLAVTGHEHVLIEAALATTNASTCYNPDHRSGMASSIVTATLNLMEKDGIVVCLGDMPHVTRQIINQLIDAMQTNRSKSIFIPVVDSKRGNPVLFTSNCFDALLELKGDTGAKHLIEKHPHEIFEVRVIDAGVLIDYDTHQELAQLQ